MLNSERSLLVTAARCALAGAIVLLGGLHGTAGELPVVTWQGQTMGSVYTVKVVGEGLKDGEIEMAKQEVEAQLKEVNRQMSHYQPDSELSRFNGAPANVPFKVSSEFARVTRFSLEVFRRSGGAFEPTLGPVVNLWGFGEKTELRAVPAPEELRAALARIGAQHLSVTQKDELIKDLPGLALNLSAVAKGFGVDEMVRVLRSHGWTNVYASIAGEVRVLGHNPRGSNWVLGIAAPVAHWRENDPMAAVVSLSNQALSTSGDYQKFFTDPSGKRLSHILDPRTGWPVQHQVGGVSVVAADSMTADALATTLFVLGPERGLELLETWTNAAALYVIRESEQSFRQIPSKRFAELTGYRAE